MELPSGSGDAPIMLPAPVTPTEGQPRIMYVYVNGRPGELAGQCGRKRGSKWVYDITKGPCGECAECVRRLNKGMVLRTKACQDLQGQDSCS